MPERSGERSRSTPRYPPGGHGLTGCVNQRAKYIKMIFDYYAFVEQRPAATFCPLELLPHSKKELVEAFLNVVANTRSKSELAHAALSIATLAYFQENVSVESWPKLPDIDMNNVAKLSSENKSNILNRIDVPEVLRLIGLHDGDVRDFRRRIVEAKSLNPHLLPWPVKLWHKLRQQGAYSPFTEQFVTIRYP